MGDSGERYQRKHEDGYVSNRLLRTPKTIRDERVVYSAVDPETLAIRGGDFVPSWDSTDHFHWICQRCKVVTDVLQVRYMPGYSNGEGSRLYALFFYLGCVKCGATGHRKIYLARRPKPARFHETLIDNEILIFGDGRDPEKRLRITKLDDVCVTKKDAQT